MHIVCSVVPMGCECHVRLAAVPSWEAYKKALELWYPELNWRLDDHRVWFNTGGLLHRVLERVEARTMAECRAEAGGSEGFTTHASDVGFCIVGKSVANVPKLRARLFDEVHSFLVDELEKGEGGDFGKEVQEHQCAQRCVLRFDTDGSATTPVYRPVDPVEKVEVECLDYATDPWDDAYPVVWSGTALKDLICLAQSYGLGKEEAVDKEEELFWAVDDMLNVRSRTKRARVTSRDICRLFRSIGYAPKHPSILDTIEHDADTDLDAYYQPHRTPNALPQELVATLPFGHDFGHACAKFGAVETDSWETFFAQAAEILGKPSSPSANADDGPVFPSVVLLGNTVTRRVVCVHETATKALAMLPETARLHSMEVLDAEHATQLVEEFAAQYTHVPTAMHKDVCTLLKHAWDFTAADYRSNGESRDEVMMARCLLERLVTSCKLAPAATWVPATAVLDLVMPPMEQMKWGSVSRDTVLALLADLVPKKRFVSGHMLQMRLPTSDDMNRVFNKICS